MKKTLVISSFLAVILTGCSSSSNTINNNIVKDYGARVHVELEDGSDYTGELLRVRDSVMILSEKYSAGEKDLADLVYNIYALKNHEINLIEIKHQSFVIHGIAFGGAAGGLIGMGVSKSGDKKEEGQGGAFDFNIDLDPLTGCCIGGITGAVVGGIIGLSFSEDEVIYIKADPDNYDFTQLNVYARYSGEEPEYLRKIER